MLRWVEGLKPQELSSEDIEVISQLFYAETGEIYSEKSIRSLPVPNWKGNLLLVEDRKIRGVLWTAILANTTCRIVAFVICKELQNMGFGSSGWKLIIENARQHGLSTIQLEVKAENSSAIDFYRKRGLEVVQKLEGYYSTGLGYVMRGVLSP